MDTSEVSPHRVGLQVTTDQTSGLFQTHLGEKVLFMNEVKTGFNNKVYIIKTNLGNYALRATKVTWPKEKVVNEVAALNFVAKRTSIPVPRVVFWNCESDEIGCRYIVMERIPGTCLADLWSGLKKEEKRSILQQIVSFMGQFHDLKFDEIGGFCFGDENGDTIKIGPYFPLMAGPFKSVTSWYSFLLSNAHTKVENNTLLSKNFLPYFPRAKAILENLLKQEQIYNAPIVFFHGDFSFRNMMVEDGKITGILDWEWAGAFPTEKDLSEGLDDIRESPDMEIFWEEARKVPKFCLPEMISGYEKRCLLNKMIDCIAPWEVGCFGEEDDIKCVQDNIQMLETILPKLEKQ